MGDISDIFDGLDAFSGGAQGGGILEALAGLFGVSQERPETQAVAYERYLCGSARTLNVNDR